MTVYVTQQPKANRMGWKPNLGPATTYGKLHFVFDADVTVTSSPNDSMQTAFEALKNFNSDEDYILWPYIGDPSSLWSIVMTLVGMGVDKINYLVWNRGEDGKDGYYQPVTFKLT